ncbi:DNA mismatch repair endonuclease MutH [Candidatus Ishikawella capsulata]|uniref:DNA mismatch repair protein MutH n=1 Tax=Candidatus Ishikawaella capsulata Mpkobe TaxID=476281 RepID=C5WCC4_9ENTR|nr:DNA mismatch repair endonuclease MutH [Candidatus Ishikawaella capsulata]BAH82980.1 DNA mismatch repair protein [Candidatus Ishikawaella capsulata Mpkobe]
MSKPFNLHNPPIDEKTLLLRAQKLAGCTIQELALKAGITVPINLKNNKGWVGILIELNLGAYGNNRAIQDFPHLGIELKTIPINSEGYPLESTFICMASLRGNIGITWNNSYVYHKLTRVLWIPVEGKQNIPLNIRRVGAPVLWSPNAHEEHLLRQDWEELIDMIALGEIENITSSYGEYMQLRSKSANKQIFTEAIGNNGQIILTTPRAFYLKKKFTSSLLARYFLL